ncbi:hypothetical protein XcuCFBP2542_08180 [Xanthomonas cucurbitae]|uniref:Uncharacterized protein n=1 Tax=Xanthomonas cucurbitae TaxID=56453 RepID=A0A2S7DSW8_9XANT|nr:hypothetical protein XcuCFBP2542_08180 [Xanthomonas cucurbitae]
MIDDLIATFGNPTIQAGRSIGVECLSFQSEMVSGDLGQATAEGMPGHSDLALQSITFFLTLRQLDRPLCQLDGIGGLGIVTRQHHAAVSVNPIL